MSTAKGTMIPLVDSAPAVGYPSGHGFTANLPDYWTTFYHIRP